MIFSLYLQRMKLFISVRGRWKKILLLAVAVVVIMKIRLYNSFEDDPYIHLKSLALTLDLPDESISEEAITSIYNRHLKEMLQQESTQVTDGGVYEERRTHLRKNCDMLRATIGQINSEAFADMWYVNNPPMFYCPAYKAGTTFWAKILHVLRLNNPLIVSPFQVFDNYGLQKKLKITTDIGDDLITITNKYLNNSLKFLFVRDPYKRLFSVYVDKVLAPNNFFWTFGSEAKRLFRKFPGNRFHNVDISQCGTDLTFKEFVNIILDINHHEKHLVPMYRLCHVCRIDYDIIGKLETFDQDVNYILKRSVSHDQRLVFKNLRYEKKLDILLYQVIRAFGLEKNWRKCMSRHSALIRLWRQLQINGFIKKGTSYPLSREESDSVSVIKYINMALEEFKYSDSSVNLNKNEAFLQAYRQLSLAELERLRALYSKDFWLFDYEDRPQELFKMKKTETQDFDYFDVLAVTA